MSEECSNLRDDVIVFFDGLEVSLDSLMRRNALPYIRYSHEASEILRDVPRKDLLSIASRRKGYG